jgi:hypothetical protein
MIGVGKPIQTKVTIGATTYIVSTNVVNGRPETLAFKVKSDGIIDYLEVWSGYGIDHEKEVKEFKYDAERGRLLTWGND